MIWSYLKNTKKPIFLYGMGNGAEIMIKQLDTLGVKPVGFFASVGFFAAGFSAVGFLAAGFFSVAAGAFSWGFSSFFSAGLPQKSL